MRLTAPCIEARDRHGATAFRWVLPPATNPAMSTPVDGPRTDGEFEAALLGLPRLPSTLLPVRTYRIPK